MSQSYVEQVTWYLLNNLYHRTQVSQNATSDNDEEVETEQNSCEEANETESSLNSLAQSHNNIFFHASMFFIWVFVTVLNMPAALAWAHNFMYVKQNICHLYLMLGFRYSKSLSPDESLIAGLVFSVGALFLWQIDLPRPNRCAKVTYFVFVFYCCQ